MEQKTTTLPAVSAKSSEKKTDLKAETMSTPDSGKADGKAVVDDLLKDSAFELVSTKLNASVITGVAANEYQMMGSIFVLVASGFWTIFKVFSENWAKAQIPCIITLILMIAAFGLYFYRKVHLQPNKATLRDALFADTDGNGHIDLDEMEAQIAQLLRTSIAVTLLVVSLAMTVYKYVENGLTDANISLAFTALCGGFATLTKIYNMYFTVPPTAAISQSATSAQSTPSASSVTLSATSSDVAPSRPRLAAVSRPTNMSALTATIPQDDSASASAKSDETPLQTSNIVRIIARPIASSDIATVSASSTSFVELTVRSDRVAFNMRFTKDTDIAEVTKIIGGLLTR